MSKIVPEIFAFHYRIWGEIVPEIAAFHVTEFCERKMTFPTIRNVKEILVKIVPYHAIGHVNNMYQ